MILSVNTKVVSFAKLLLEPLQIFGPLNTEWHASISGVQDCIVWVTTVVLAAETLVVVVVLKSYWARVSLCTEHVRIFVIERHGQGLSRA